MISGAVSRMKPSARYAAFSSYFKPRTRANRRGRAALDAASAFCQTWSRAWRWHALRPAREFTSDKVALAPTKVEATHRWARAVPAAGCCKRHGTRGTAASRLLRLHRRRVAAALTNLYQHEGCDPKRVSLEGRVLHSFSGGHVVGQQVAAYHTAHTEPWRALPLPRPPHPSQLLSQSRLDSRAHDACCEHQSPRHVSDQRPR